MKQDIRGIKDDMHLLMCNHLPHLQEAIDETGEKTEQAWGMANSAAKDSRDTKRFVVGGVTFLGLIIAIIECLG
jgi:hypothetical protein